jgi:hypothetical protein
MAIPLTVLVLLQMIIICPLQHFQKLYESYELSFDG